MAKTAIKLWVCWLLLLHMLLQHMTPRAEASLRDAVSAASASRMPSDERTSAEHRQQEPWPQLLYHSIRAWAQETLQLVHVGGAVRAQQPNTGIEEQRSPGAWAAARRVARMLYEPLYLPQHHKKQGGAKSSTMAETYEEALKELWGSLEEEEKQHLGAPAQGEEHDGADPLLASGTAGRCIIGGACQHLPVAAEAAAPRPSCEKRRPAATGAGFRSQQPPAPLPHRTSFPHHSALAAPAAAAPAGAKAVPRQLHQARQLQRGHWPVRVPLWAGRRGLLAAAHPRLPPGEPDSGGGGGCGPAAAAHLRAVQLQELRVLQVGAAGAGDSRPGGPAYLAGWPACPA